MILYTATQAGKLTIEIKRAPGNAGTEIHLKRDQSWPMCVVVYDLNAKKSRIFDLMQTVSITETYAHYTDTDYTPFTSYIWRIESLTAAQHYAAVFPYQAGLKPTLTVGKNADIISIRVQGTAGTWLGMINIKSYLKYLIDSEPIKLDPGKPVFLKSEGYLDNNMIIRDTLMPKNVAYRDLSLEERELYIPKELTTGGALQIHYVTVYRDWVLATDNLYRGTLTYVPTRDKDIHMIDENRNKYRYGIDHFRQMIPHLYNGVINGTFRYVGRGNRNIKYVLVPHEIGGNDLMLCDSSDSESDSDIKTTGYTSNEPDESSIDDSILDLL